MAPSGSSSEPALLALHGVRVLGAPSVAAIADRFRLRVEDVREHLLDAEAYGWVSKYNLGREAWSLTERGRVENERQLAAELDGLGLRNVVTDAYRRFLALNDLHSTACTNWQLRPTRWDRYAVNDHSDPTWDVAVLVELERIDDLLGEIDALLVGALARFDGYARRHREALTRVRLGGHEWLDGPDRPSCQLIWMQLHEDLIATLQRQRGEEPW